MTSTFIPTQLARDPAPVTRAAPLADAVREAAMRATLATGLAGIAVIHAVDSVGQWEETRYLFWMYMGLIVSAIAIGAAVLFTTSRLALLAAAGLAASAFIGYVLSRTTGLPGDAGDVGNWTESLGLASLVVEGLVIAVGLAGYRGAR
jgi:hypothetical protein